MKTYTLQYDNYTIEYEIEGDVDGIHAILLGIKNEVGAPVNEAFFDKETLADMKFICESEFSDLQFNHYKKTGEWL